MNANNPWDERFSTEEYVYGLEPNAFLREKAEYLRPGQTLSIAEGEGRNAVFLAKKGLHVTAWDYSHVALQKCKAYAAAEHVTVETALVDLSHADWEPGRWDNTVAIFAHFPSAIRSSVLHGIASSVKPEGCFLAEVYSVHQLSYKTGGPRDADFLYRPEEFLQAFADWDIIHFFTGEVERREGKLHNGLSHVIQFFGKKRA